MEPVAWAFYYPDGRLRFIVEGRERAEAWRTAHEGDVVPLYPGKPDDQGGRAGTIDDRPRTG